MRTGMWERWDRDVPAEGMCWLCPADVAGRAGTPVLCVCVASRNNQSWHANPRTEPLGSGEKERDFLAVGLGAQKNSESRSRSLASNTFDTKQGR